MEVHIQDIVRKHELLTKDNLTEEEKTELQKIEDYITGINKELLELEAKGFKLVKGHKIAKAEEIEVPEKLTISERKEKSLEIIKSEIKKGSDEKTIIKAVCALLGVSVTYAYEAVKRYKTEETQNGISNE